MNKLTDFFDSKGLADAHTQVTLHDSILDVSAPTALGIDYNDNKNMC